MHYVISAYFILYNMCINNVEMNLEDSLENIIHIVNDNNENNANSIIDYLSYLV